jgi:hypothetical protein
MQLPDELVRIVSEFSKPRLRYPRDYKLALAATNRDRWPRLMKKLSSPEADQVVKTLRVYIDAKTQSQAFNTLYRDTFIHCEVCLLTPQEQAELTRNYIESIHLSVNVARDLEALLV